MEESPPVGGFILCHQSLKGNQVVRQMRPLTDWSVTWYTEASSKPVSKKAKAAAKKKAKSKSKKSRAQKKPPK